MWQSRENEESFVPCDSASLTFKMAKLREHRGISGSENERKTYVEHTPTNGCSEASSILGLLALASQSLAQATAVAVTIRESIHLYDNRKTRRLCYSRVMPSSLLDYKAQKLRSWFKLIAFVFMRLQIRSHEHSSNLQCLPQCFERTNTFIQGRLWLKYEIGLTMMLAIRWGRNLLSFVDTRTTLNLVDHVYFQQTFGGKALLIIQSSALEIFVTTIHLNSYKTVCSEFNIKNIRKLFHARESFRLNSQVRFRQNVQTIKVVCKFCG